MLRSVLLAAVWLATATWARAQTPPQPSVEVLGEATLDLVPNQIYVLVSLTPYQDEGKRWVSADTLEGQLKAAIAAENAAETTLELLDSYSISAPWLGGDYDEDEDELPSRPMGRTLPEVRFFRLRFAAPRNLDAIFKRIDPRGIGKVKVEKLWHDAYETHYTTLLGQASQNAQRRAEAILLPLGAKPGGVLRVGPESLQDKLRDSFMEQALMRSMQEREGGEDLDLTGRKLTLSVRNYYTFAIVK
ncbi:MAG: hypothetical protein SFY70_06635 [Bacteroidia bacterium]|nr:hypothetical protein [Bacteroidia bacterium]